MGAIWPLPGLLRENIFNKVLHMYVYHTMAYYVKVVYIKTIFPNHIIFHPVITARTKLSISLCLKVTTRLPSARLWIVCYSNHAFWEASTTFAGAAPIWLAGVLVNLTLLEFNISFYIHNIFNLFLLFWWALKKKNWKSKHICLVGGILCPICDKYIKDPKSQVKF